MQRDEVQQAMQILTVFKHCRQQASQLQKCQKEKVTAEKEWFATGPDCTMHQQAFETCAETKSTSAVNDLIAVGRAKCPQEVAALAACQRRPGNHNDDACAHEDMAMLQCAARFVVQSSRQR